ncbi:MAG: cyclopropane-fatty-acyl-phospholipid synthase [Acidiferrobacterales bacterium]|nr:cyclopropane-fatty-acyl-phospholipid synthase [Acidiferrobacterales bacterium]
MEVKKHAAPLALETNQPKSGESSSAPTALDRSLVRRLLDYSGNPRIDVQLWDGETISVANQESIATVKFNSRSAYRRMLTQGEIGFGDGYSDGQIEIEGELVEFLCEAYRAKKHSDKNPKGVLQLQELLSRKKPRKNTLAGSKSNIHHHYDLGNEFYSLWLDREAMQYTCAYYPIESMTLEQAQVAKMEHVCRKLMLQPGQTVVEAGCGWGGLARYMAKTYGVNVRSYNISHEQIVYATEQARQEGLDDLVEYVEDDYRNITGSYDVFVSIGMLEHVGSQNYQALGAVVDRCLAENGRALVHSIGRNTPELMSAWIEKRIFPGAYPPTIREMMDIVEPFNFSVLDIENLRLHYAKTLGHWLERFNDNEEKICGMFDDRFVRAWRLYLSGSISAFLVGTLQLFQIAFARGADNSIAMTREHLYPYQQS